MRGRPTVVAVESPPLETVGSTWKSKGRAEPVAGPGFDWKPFHLASALSQLHVPSTSGSHNLDQLHRFVTGLSAIKTKPIAAFRLFGPYLKREK